MAVALLAEMIPIDPFIWSSMLHVQSQGGGEIPLLSNVLLLGFLLMPMLMLMLGGMCLYICPIIVLNHNPRGWEGGGHCDGGHYDDKTAMTTGRGV